MNTPTVIPENTGNPSKLRTVGGCTPECQSGQKCENGICLDVYTCDSGYAVTKIYKNSKAYRTYNSGCTRGNIDGHTYNYMYSYSCPTEEMPQDKPIKSIELCAVCSQGANCAKYYNQNEYKSIETLLINKGYVKFGSNFYEPEVAIYTPGYQAPTPTSTPEYKRGTSLIPRLECVTDNGDGNLTAYFGYENTTDQDITIQNNSNKQGERNSISNNYISYVNFESENNINTQIKVFKKGVHKGVIQVVFRNSSSNKISWELQYNEEAPVVVTADANSPRCKNVVPKFECIREDSLYKLPFAIYSYENENDCKIYIPAGNNNDVLGIVGETNTKAHGQPELFMQGKNKAASFRIQADKTITWKIKDNESNGFLTAASEDKICEDYECSFINTHSIKEQFKSWIDNYKNILTTATQNSVLRYNISNSRNMNALLDEFIELLDYNIIDENIFNCSNKKNCSTYKVTYKTSELLNKIQMVSNEVQSIKDKFKNGTCNVTNTNQQNGNYSVLQDCNKAKQLIDKLESEIGLIISNLAIFNDPILTNRTYCFENSESDSK